MTRPRIAVLMDENTLSGGSRYEAHKGYFHHVIEAGGSPFGVPYDLRLVDAVIESFDGLLTAGGRFAFPAEWYVAEPAQNVETTRLDVEQALVRGFLEQGKPILGMCAGMQTLACMHGARLTPTVDGHDQGRMHLVAVAAGSQLERLIGPELMVNSYHRKAIAQLSPEVVASAVSADGVIEAIEIPRSPFAIGLQWHQELLGQEHVGQAIIRGFVQASA